MRRSILSQWGGKSAGRPGVPIRIVKGLDIPIAGAPEQIISDGAEVRSVGLVGNDYPGLRPLMLVEEGARVKAGQALFADRRRPEVLFTSPASGIVRRINRGTRRTLLSFVVELTGHEGKEFNSWPAERLVGLRREQVVERLLASGLWVSLRSRPFSKVPDPQSAPSSVFVTAMDSNPLAADAAVVIQAYRQDFESGLAVIAHLTEGPVFLCRAPGVNIPSDAAGRASVAEFSGPHPSGLVGTHIHFLDPVGPGKFVWHLGYQDVIGIGKLFTSGKLWFERVVALAGPLVNQPRLVRAPLGASTDDLTRGELGDATGRIISGSILSGHHAWGHEAYLGRYHCQVSVIAEDVPEDAEGWLMPRRRKAFSSYRLPTPDGRRRHHFAMTTALHGRPEALLPLSGFERVMPLDILPTQLLRALLVGDWDLCRALGCLELDEEDLALCTFVCPSKYDYGPKLRACLETIEKEG
jgi:Na+-transporting NADH:ubiquinone oxidoreductase subunit A